MIIRCVVGNREADMCDWGGVFRHVACLSAWLRQRAESYGRDAWALREAGDTASAVAYETIRDELRRTAESLTEEAAESWVKANFDASLIDGGDGRG